jgi:hypothetical protein
MKVAVAANTLAESATTSAVPYVDVHETHTGVVVLAGRRLPGEYPYGARPVPGRDRPQRQRGRRRGFASRWPS